MYIIKDKENFIVQKMKVNMIKIKLKAFKILRKF